MADAGSAWLRTIGRGLSILGVNAVPAAGYLGGGWSGATALAFYWCETVLIAALVAARIALHWRLTRKRGHLQPPTLAGPLQGAKASFSGKFLGRDFSWSLDDLGKRGTRATNGSLLLRGFAVVAGPLLLAHGALLLVVLAFVLPEHGGEAAGKIDAAALRRGVPLAAASLGVGFLFDALGLRERSYRWLELTVERVVGRVVALQLVMLVGVTAMVLTGAPSVLFAVFVAFKTLADLATLLPVGEDDPAGGWLVRKSRRFAADLATELERADRAELSRRESNEEIVSR
jgi:hypothetical protein